MPDWVIARRRAIGARMREERRAARLTQIQLGEKIGRDNKTISRWENGLSVPTVDDLILIAHALSITVSELTRTE